MGELPIRRRRFAFLPLIRWLPQQCLRFSLPVAVSLTLFARPLWLFCFGIQSIPVIMQKSQKR
jgi:hypothetical protein